MKTVIKVHIIFIVLGIIVATFASLSFTSSDGGQHPTVIPAYEGPSGACYGGDVFLPAGEDNQCLLYALALMNARNYFGATLFSDPYTIGILNRLKRAVRADRNINLNDGASAAETNRIILIKQAVMQDYLDDNAPTTGPVGGYGNGGGNGGGPTPNNFPPGVFGNNWNQGTNTPAGTSPLAAINWAITGPAFTVNIIAPGWPQGHFLSCVAGNNFNCQAGTGSIICTEHPNQGGRTYWLNVAADGTFSGVMTSPPAPGGGTYSTPISGSVGAAFGEVP